TGHAMWNKTGGHPGPDRQCAAVRRIRIPRDGHVVIRGQATQREKRGDGIRLLIAHGKKKRASVDLHGTNRPMPTIDFDAKEGDLIDFIAAPKESAAFDSFTWKTLITIETSDGPNIELDSEQDFAGRQGAPPSQAAPARRRLLQLAQTLLISNEMAFVD
ncbi:MAG: hypothetical protein AAFP69_13130, partial [Planctomycetota bacterium]